MAFDTDVIVACDCSLVQGVIRIMERVQIIGMVGAVFPLPIWPPKLSIVAG